MYIKQYCNFGYFSINYLISIGNIFFHFNLSVLHPTYLQQAFSTLNFHNVVAAMLSESRASTPSETPLMHVLKNAALVEN